jgi:hypothetical protein
MTHTARLSAAASIGVTVLAALACATPPHPQTQPSATRSIEVGTHERQSPPQHVGELPGLENVYRLAVGIYSGSEPHGAEAFAALAELGVRVIVSVDGARPDITAATVAGMRYIHVPIPYSSIPDEARLAFARIAREIQEPMYVHCHHGKHRGPAGAAVILRERFSAPPADGRRVLEAMGTSPSYAGLWRAVEAYVSPDATTRLPELLSVSTAGGYAELMAALSRSWEQLDLIRQSGWQTPPDHPDLAPAQEALIAFEALAELVRRVEEQAAPVDAVAHPDFKTWHVAARDDADALRAALAAGDSGEADARYARVTQTCSSCHAAYRN